MIFRNWTTLVSACLRVGRFVLVVLVLHVLRDDTCPAPSLRLAGCLRRVGQTAFPRGVATQLTVFCAHAANLIGWNSIVNDIGKRKTAEKTPGGPCCGEGCGLAAALSALLAGVLLGFTLGLLE